jgi:hypothetical protein
VGEEPVDVGANCLATADYCREIEAHLCRKNDGHLIRVVGPSFDLVARWAERGVPLKVALAGIDRYFERYYRNGPRRRPVRIDFCEADVLDVFDEWRRATGVTVHSNSQSSISDSNFPFSSLNSQTSISESRPRRVSVADHLMRVGLRLSQVRAQAPAVLGSGLDAIIDKVGVELDAARARAGGLRGEARAALIARLATLDRELIVTARAALDADALAALEKEADQELAPFRQQMAAEAHRRSRDAALARLIRERSKLPTIAFE